MIAASSSAPADQLRAHHPGGRLRRGLGLARECMVVLEHAALEARGAPGTARGRARRARSALTVRRERIRLPPRAVEGDDPLCLEALAVRVRGDERLELSGERRVPPRPRGRESSAPRSRRAGSRRAARPRPPANGSYARSASAGPRHSASASRDPSAPSRRAARTVRRRAGPAPPGRGTPAGGSRSGRRRPPRAASGRAPGGRSEARAGGDSPQIASIRRSVETDLVRGGGVAVRAGSGVSAPRAQPAPRRRRPPPAAPASGTPTP